MSEITLKISLMDKFLDKITTFEFAVDQQSNIVKYYVDFEAEAGSGYLAESM